MRCLEAKNSTHFSTAYFAHQLLESWALNQSAGGTPKIVINRGNLSKSQFAGSLDETVLKTLTLLIVNELCRLGLPNVNNGT
jgi:hypothetical protein